MGSSDQEIHDAAIIDGAKDIAFGSIAGMVAKVFEHPFDLCKVRLQAQVLDHTARFSGPWDCLSSTWRNEGVRGLYRGLPAPIVGAMAENATLFLTYRQLQRILRWMSGSSELRPAQLALAAAGAGAATSFVLTPIELVKCKMQVQLLVLESSSPSSPSSTADILKLSGATLKSNSPSAVSKITAAAATTTPPNFHTLPGPLAILRGIVRSHGVRGLWLGQTGTLIRETGGAVAWFGSKETVSKFLLRSRERHLLLYADDDSPSPSPSSSSRSGSLTSKDLLAWESALAGAVAGVAYNVVLFPADSVKSMMQTSEELRRGGGGAESASASASGSTNVKTGTNGHRAHASFWGTARDMFVKRGVRGLYAGCGITTLRAIPSSAMIFLIYDGLNRRFS